MEKQVAPSGGRVRRKMVAPRVWMWRRTVVPGDEYRKLVCKGQGFSSATESISYVSNWQVKRKKKQASKQPSWCESQVRWLRYSPGHPGVNDQRAVRAQ